MIVIAMIKHQSTGRIRTPVSLTQSLLCCLALCLDPASGQLFVACALLQLATEAAHL